MNLTASNYIYQKEIDWSVLNYGINISTAKQFLIYNALNIELKKGENKKINIVFNNKTFNVKIFNQSFDEKKYPNHKDLLQVRYSSTSPIAKELQNIFKFNYNYLLNEKNKLKNKRLHIKLPEEQKEFIILYATTIKDTFLLEYINNDELNNNINQIKDYSEEEFEFNINYLNKVDTTATIQEKLQINKVRKLDKSICDNLKKFYNHKCQICGVTHIEKYNCEVSEAHHIEPFVKSLNNNSNNIIILCPNHHRIIHKSKAKFDYKNRLFIYQNGLRESLSLNEHL